MTPERGYFINVDLEVRSKRRLGPLVKALEAAGFMVLADMKWHEGGYFASFEYDFASGRILRAADAKVRLMVNAIEKLTPAVRALWDGATTRVFDLGIQGGFAQRLALRVPLSRLAMKRIAAVSGELNITIYAAGERPRTAEEAAFQQKMQNEINRRIKRSSRAQLAQRTRRKK